MSDKVSEDVLETDTAFFIRPLTTPDRNWVAQHLDEHWGSTKIVSRGQVHYAHLLPGFLALQGTEDSPGAPVGLITYRVEGDGCEIMTIDSLVKSSGIGTALIEAVKGAAAAEGCKRLWLITTNDNLHALRFYQRRGFRLSALHINALEESRKLKPQIPLIGMHNIPLRDELELSMNL